MTKIALGLMSGTSLDGIDVALAKIDGFSMSTNLHWLDFETYPYEAKDLEAIHQVMSGLVDIRHVSSLHNRLGHVYADAVINFCKRHAIQLADLAFIASHGQTVCHLGKAEDPYSPSTLQLGDGSIIAQRCQTDVVSDFRTADMALGGQGAPLVPYADYVLFSQENKGRIMQNIGGIGNLTVLPRQGQIDEIMAFDTGPGNMLIDAAVQHFYDRPFDKDGAIARSGSSNQKLLSWLKNHPFFHGRPPKSAGREQFGQAYFKTILSNFSKVRDVDVVATLTQFTVDTMVEAYERFVMPQHTIDEVIVSGGGAYNKTLLEQLRIRLPSCKVMPLEALGFNSKAKEAMCFIVLANETLHGQPANIPKATGASQPAILGKISRYK